MDAFVCILVYNKLMEIKDSGKGIKGKEQFEEEKN
jgi:hypothetical protein